MKKGPIFISFTYFIMGMLWIIYSDWLAYHIFSTADVRMMTIYQNIKGGIYILLTSSLLYFLINFSQKKLMGSHNKYLELFKSNPNPMMIFNSESLKIQDVNEAALSLYGYLRNEFLLLTIDKLFVDEAPPNVYQNSESKETDSFFDMGIWRHNNKNGNILYVNISCQKVNDGKNIGMLYLVQDISKQKEYENKFVNLTKNLEDIIAKRTIEIKNANKELSLFNQQLTLSNKQLFLANQKIKEQSEVIQKQNKENLNRILNSLNDVVWSIDLRTKKFVYLSNSVEKVTGIPYLEFKSNVAEWNKLVHPDDRKIIKDRLKGIFSTGYSDTTYRLLRPDGGLVWIYDKVNLIKDKDDKPILMEGIASDITSLKSAEDEIIKYAHRLNLILQSITDGFFTIDREFRFTRVNQVFAKLVGLERKKLLGKLFWELFPPDLYPDLYLKISDSMENNISSHYQGYFDKFNLWFDIKFYPYVEGLSIFFRDISEEKKIQQGISFSKKNLDALINNTTDLIWSVDKNMRILSANTAFLEKFESSTGIRLKIGDSMLSDAFIGNNISAWREQYSRTFKGESFTIIQEGSVNNQHESFEISFNPIYDDNNEVFGIGCFGRNITERRHHEEERNQLIQRLIAQNNGLEEFGYITSHKIRAPVANILGIVNLLNKDSIADDYNRNLIEYLGVAATNLDETIWDLTRILDMQKVRQEVMEEVSLAEVCKQARKVLKTMIKETGAIIHCNFSQAKMAYTVKSILLNVLVELLSNSMTYKKPNRPAEIHVDSTSEGGYVEISVSDNGMGIDLSRYGDQLFKLYKRFHFHTPGKGMGLYMVKSQVEALDGKLEVISEADKGSTFKVYIKQRQSSPVLS